MREEEKEIIADLPKWKGYDIDELRYRRAYMLARCEIEKMRIMGRIDSMRSSMPSIASGGGIAARILKGLSYFDYAFIAYRVASRTTKLLSKFRHKK